MELHAPWLEFCGVRVQDDERMNELSPKAQWTVWGLLAAVIAIVVASYVFSQVRPTATSKSQLLPPIGQVAEFTLTNQDGAAVNLASLRGHVWVADIIFTRCPGPCVAMTRHMAALQSALKPDPRVKLISLTADPLYDTPLVLKEYGKKFGVNFESWNFLTGPKKTIYRLATEDLKLVVVDNSDGGTPPEESFLHSTKFILLDAQARLRGVFEGDSPESKTNLLAAIDVLLHDS